MKLRIKGNSIRLRLLRSEVAQLAAGQRVEETIQLGTEPEQRLTYAAELSITEPRLRVLYEPTRWLVLLPAADVSAWAASEQVGLYETISLGAQGTLDIAIEKDFACLDQSDAENVDTFAHPSAGTAC